MRILILGSCVTRDAFEMQPAHKPLEIAEYFARSALASAMDREPFSGVDLERIESSFQRRVVEYDLYGTFADYLDRGEFDLLVVDAIDERFDLLVQPSGAVATRSSEFNRSEYDATDDTVVPSGSVKGLQRWEDGWARLVEILDRQDRLQDLRMNRAMWATRVEGDGTFPAVFTPERIDAGNRHLSWMYKRAARDLPDDQFYDYHESDLVAAAEHRWGVSPFHYTQSYYETLLGHMFADQSAR